MTEMIEDIFNFIYTYFSFFSFFLNLSILVIYESDV